MLCNLMLENETHDGGTTFYEETFDSMVFNGREFQQNKQWLYNWDEDGFKAYRTTAKTKIPECAVETNHR